MAEVVRNDTCDVIWASHKLTGSTILAKSKQSEQTYVEQLA